MAASTDGKSAHSSVWSFEKPAAAASANAKRALVPPMSAIRKVLSGIDGDYTAAAAASFPMTSNFPLSMVARGATQDPPTANTLGSAR